MTRGRPERLLVLPALLLLASCAPRKEVLLPSPPLVVRKEAVAVAPEPAPPVPKPADPGPPLSPAPAPPIPELLYRNAIRRTREALLAGKPREAIPSWSELDGTPLSREARFNRAVLTHLSGDVEGAEREYSRLAGEPHPHEGAVANLLAGRILRGEIREARALAERTLPHLDTGPHIGELPMNVAAALIESGDAARAAPILERMSGRPGAPQELPWNLAVLSWKRGDPAGARRWSGRLSPELSPLWPVAASRLAWAEEGEPVPAVDLPPGKEPRLKRMFRNLSAFEALRKGDLPAAESLLREASEPGEAQGEILTNLGMVQALLGKWSESRENLERAVEVDPGLAQAWLNLGIFREVYEGNGDSARECYERYDKLGGLRKEEARRWADWLGQSPPR